MPKKRNITTPITILFIYCLYFIVTIFHSNFWGNILSPTLAMIASLSIFNHLFKLKSIHDKLRKLIWLFYGLACLSWAIADIIWALYVFFLDMDPIESQPITYLYLMTNIFLVAGLIIFIITLLKKWNAIQLVIDSIFISSSCILLFWIVFFNKNIIMFEIISNDGISSLLSILIDVGVFVGIAIWYLSLRKGSVPLFLRSVSTGVTLFVLADLYYYYIYFNQQYLPNSIIDALYIGSLLLLSLGASLEDRHFSKNNALTIPEIATNIGIEKKGLLLLLCPVLGFFYEGFVIPDLLFFLLLILLHQIFSTHIQNAIRNEVQLKNEKELNLVLEEKIKQRTKEIVEKNIELEEKNKELDFLSNQDTVTNLYNRRFFIKSLKDEINDCRPLHTIGLLFIDLDRFKTINDMYGHQIGDQVLVEIAKRLEKLCHGNAILARLGGDEFVLGYNGKFNYKQLEQIAIRIINMFTDPIEIEPYVFYVTASIGISIYPYDAKDAHSLMRNADIAMYQAKAQGKNRCVSFDSKIKNFVNRKNDIEILLNKVDFSHEFQLYYQPQFRTSDKKLIGAEALIRWNNSAMGPVSPAEFIPIAEEINMINEIGIWVLENAIHQSKIWNDTYASELKIGINVSPKQLDHKTFIRDLKDLMHKYMIPSNFIDIEITESVAIEGESRIQQIESLFSGVGVSISVDDFGTGYSSLSYLKFFPFERIKIAKPLIDAIEVDNYDMQIVKAVITLAKSIGMKTIAEGVENQGYFLGKPVSADQFYKLYLI